MPSVKPSPVRKADKPVAVVYDQKGRLIGLVDPDKIVRVADLSASETDLDPVPPAEVGTPADGVAKSRAAVAALRKRMHTSPDVAEQERIAEALAAAAVRGLRIIHHGRRGAA